MHAIIVIIIYIYMQKLTTMDQYWQTYGLVKVNFVMASFEANTQQALITPILDHFKKIMHVN